MLRPLVGFREEENDIYDTILKSLQCQEKNKVDAKCEGESFDRSAM